MEAVLEFLKQEWVMAVIGALYVLLEYWLGKTTLVKPGSTLEAILSGIKKLLELFGLGKKDPKILK
jgi:uncharacterized membrane protein